MDKQLQDLIDKLEERFPNVLPMTVDDDLLRLIGQQDVIKYLYGYIEAMSRQVNR